MKDLVERGSKVKDAIKELGQHVENSGDRLDQEEDRSIEEQDQYVAGEDEHEEKDPTKNSASETGLDYVPMRILPDVKAGDWVYVISDWLENEAQDPYTEPVLNQYLHLGSRISEEDSMGEGLTLYISCKEVHLTPPASCISIESLDKPTHPVDTDDPKKVRVDLEDKPKYHHTFYQYKRKLAKIGVRKKKKATSPYKSAGEMVVKTEKISVKFTHEYRLLYSSTSVA